MDYWIVGSGMDTGGQDEAEWNTNIAFLSFSFFKTSSMRMFHWKDIYIGWALKLGFLFEYINHDGNFLFD